MAAPDVRMRNVFLDLGDADARRIVALRERAEFFWLDLDLDSPGAERLGDLLRIPEHVLGVLRDVSSTETFHRSYVDEAQVLFPFPCIGEPEAPPLGSEGMKPCEVQVLVRGDYIVTVHHGACEPLRELAGDPHRVTRSEQHFVYTVLEQMVASVFESVAHLSAEAERTAGQVGEAHTGRQSLGFIREGQARLNHLRARLGPQLAVFERFADEIPEVKNLSGDDHHYSANIRSQLNYAIASVDAANDALGATRDLGLSRMTFIFTVVATVFLPISFLVGFWGMNFQLMLDNITSPATFWLLGIGGLLVSILGSLWAIRRQLGPREAPDRSSHS
ncbi:MAG: CorA family divalent cation transporter [Solirubrobacterales bacterium]